MMNAGLPIHLLSIIIPALIFAMGVYIAFLIYTRAFKEMGFSAVEAIIILLISLVFRYPIYICGVDISNPYLFSYNNWIVCINVGGGLIPIIISLYLAVKKRISLPKMLIAMVVVSFFAYNVTYPDPARGIVSPFPRWLAPALMASALSAILYINDYRKAAPTAYISGTLGVLIGADMFHLPELLSYHLDRPVVASIGGANVFDMVYVTGILAAFLDGILFIRSKKKVYEVES